MLARIRRWEEEGTLLENIVGQTRVVRRGARVRVVPPHWLSEHIENHEAIVQMLTDAMVQNLREDFRHDDKENKDPRLSV